MFRDSLVMQKLVDRLTGRSKLGALPGEQSRAVRVTPP